MYSSKLLDFFGSAWTQVIPPRVSTTFLETVHRLYICRTTRCSTRFTVSVEFECLWSSCENKACYAVGHLLLPNDTQLSCLLFCGGYLGSMTRMPKPWNFRFHQRDLYDSAHTVIKPSFMPSSFNDTELKVFEQNTPCPRLPHISKAATWALTTVKEWQMHIRCHKMFVACIWMRLHLLQTTDGYWCMHSMLCGKVWTILTSRVFVFHVVAALLFWIYSNQLQVRLHARPLTYDVCTQHFCFAENTWVIHVVSVYTLELGQNLHRWAGSHLAWVTRYDLLHHKVTLRIPVPR